MKQITCLSAIASVLLSVASCSKDVTESSNEIKFNIGYPSTKADSNHFEADDQISLYAVEYDAAAKMPLQIGGNYFNNEKVIYDGSAWAGTHPLYWSDKPCDFYALYPYQDSFTSIENHPFMVAADQNGDGYEASDLLFAYAENVSRNPDGVDLVFEHILSKLRVNIVKGPKFEGDIPSDIVAHVYNTIVDCSLNLSTGSVSKTSMGTRKTITMKKLDNEHFEAVIVPQNLERKTPLIELTMGGIAYLLETSLSFRAGYVHTLTVTLNTSPDQEQIEISIDPGINPWG